MPNLTANSKIGISDNVKQFTQQLPTAGTIISVY